MTQVKTLDFTGQSFFCGIDVHKKSWSVCIRDAERELQSFSQDADPDVLAARLKKYYPKASVSLVYEAGFSGYWAQQRLDGQGFNCKVVHAADVPQSDRDRRYKTDAVDCRKLALELSKGSLNFIHIPSQATIENRSLVRTREQLVKDQTRYKNRITSFLDFMGVRIPEGYKNTSHFSKRFINWLNEIDLAGNSKAALNIKIEMLQAVRAHLLKINQQLRTLAQSEEYSHSIMLLMSIPGIGSQSALIILTELEDISRFKNFDHLSSYVGFKPDIYSSGENTAVKNITRHCNHTLRETLVECSWMAIGKDPALTQAYYEYKRRMHYNKAILRIAKKLLNRIRYVLTNKQPYQIGIVQ